MCDEIEPRNSVTDAASEQMGGRPKRIEARFDRLESKMRSHFLWILGFEILTLATVWGSFLALQLRRS